MSSAWLVTLSWCALALGFASAGWVTGDIYARD